MTCGAAGHEGSGVVVALGEGVNDWKVGDRAGIRPLLDVCHECEHCRNGMEGLCPKVRFFSSSFPLPSSASSFASRPFPPSARPLRPSPLSVARESPTDTSTYLQLVPTGAVVDGSFAEVRFLLSRSFFATLTSRALAVRRRSRSLHFSHS
jgi:D-arabinose 1-dehydrogenase-like Zn-dependent alcohol dehydrogenase